MIFMTKLPISVVVLTYNEEKNIENCLKSVADWVEDIFVVDSYSEDKTIEIASKYTSHVVQRSFVNYSEQRNWSLENLPIQTEWIFNLDADHRVTDRLRDDLIKLFISGKQKSICGVLVSRKVFFMNRWIKHGGIYPTYHAPLFKKGYGYCEKKLYDQHFIVRGAIELLDGDIIDIVSDSLERFTERHNKWSSLEASYQLNRVDREFSFDDERKKRRILRNAYFNAPLFLRVFVYFVYRYIFRFGFLDGKEGLIFHFLQCFWYRLLVDAKIYEYRHRVR